MRVHIHPPSVADRDEYLTAVRASRALHEPWLHLADTSDGFNKYLARYALDDQRSYLIRESGSDSLVGFVNVNNIVRGAFHSAFLGYGAFAGGESRGLMTEALRLVIDDLFRVVGLHRVEANIQPGNTSSIELVKRVHFRNEGFSPDYLFVDGEWRDHERWALTVENWIVGSTPAEADKKTLTLPKWDSSNAH